MLAFWCLSSKENSELMHRIHYKSLQKCIVNGNHYLIAEDEKRTTKYTEGCVPDRMRRYLWVTT